MQKVKNPEPNATTKRFPRTAKDTSPYSIQCPPRTPWWHVVLRTIAILTAIVITIVCMTIWLIPR